MIVREGGLEFEIPEQADAGTGDAVFYNPVQELNRDITIATLRAARDQWELETYLDGMTATGVRGCRAAADGWTVTCCDVDPAAVELCEANLSRNDLEAEVRHADVNGLMHRRPFDVIDIDPFGTPVPFLDAAVRSARGLLCVTATDTAPLCGAHFRSGVRRYGAVPRNTEFHPEMGLRILLSAIVRTAARYDTAVTPVLSHVSDHYARTYLRVESGAKAADERIDDLGYVDHCPECLFREYDRGLLPDPCDSCPACGSRQVRTAGPLWLARPDDEAFVRAVRDRLDEDCGTAETAAGLLERIRAELDEPTHYDQHRLTKRWGEPAIAMDELIEALRAAGYEASRTHYSGTSFKTSADVTAIRAALV